MKDRSGAPVFVKVAEYREIIDVLDMIKAKVNEIRATLADIHDLRSQEDAEVARWNETINGIENKIESIDKMMFEPENM